MEYKDLTKEDIQYIEGLITAKNRGLRVNGRELTAFVNNKLNRNYRVTTCGSCLRQRISELERAYKAAKEKFEAEQTKNKEVETKVEAVVEELEIKVENETIETEKEVEEVVEEPKKEVEAVETEPKKTKAPAKRKSTGRKKKKES